MAEATPSVIGRGGGSRTTGVCGIGGWGATMIRGPTPPGPPWPWSAWAAFVVSAARGNFRVCGVPAGGCVWESATCAGGSRCWCARTTRCSVPPGARASRRQWPRYVRAGRTAKRRIMAARRGPTEAAPAAPVQAPGPSLSNDGTAASPADTVPATEDGPASASVSSGQASGAGQKFVGSWGRLDRMRTPQRWIRRKPLVRNSAAGGAARRRTHRWTRQRSLRAGTRAAAAPRWSGWESARVSLARYPSLSALRWPLRHRLDRLRSGAAVLPVERRLAGR